MFIKLTRVSAPKRDFYIRADAIITIAADADGNTTISTSNEFAFPVIETPGEILALTRASQIVNN